MKPKTIIQLGAGQWMTHSIQRLRQEGYRVFAADRDPAAPGFAFADGAAAVDIVDAAAIATYAQQIQADLIMVVNGAGVVSGAVASQRLGLPGLPPDVARSAQDKGRCRHRWRECGLLQPNYQVVDNSDQFAEVAAAIGYPVVIKPTTRWGSRGVCLVQHPAELAWATAFIRRHAGTESYIIEEAILGTEVSVEGLVQRGHTQVLAVADKEMQDHPNIRVGMVLNYPAAMSPAQLQAVDETTQRAIAALGIENGAFDIECMVNDRGVYLLELNPRPGGGHIFGQIVEAVSGVCMPVAYAKILFGEDVDIRPQYQRGVCYKFFAPPPGIFRGVRGLEEAARSPGVLEFGFDMATGTRVGPIEADADRPGFIVASGPDRQTAIDNVRRASAALQFDMQPRTRP
jgi:cysteine synthase A